MPKYLLIFDKGESVRWLGHLDILRAFERAIRRAELPIAFSGGFNPRERIAFASALSTGMTGEAERATLELTASLDTEEIVTRLNEALPPGIRILACEPLDDAAAKETLTAYNRAEYRVVCLTPERFEAHQVEAAIHTLMQQNALPIVREREGKSKTVDVRPSLFSLSLEADSLSEDRLALRMSVGQGESGTARPQEVVGALAEYLPGLHARRAHRVMLMKSTAHVMHLDQDSGDSVDDLMGEGEMPC